MVVKDEGKGKGAPKEKERTQEADVTTKVVGDFGRWQLKISVLMSLLKLSNAWYQMNIIFMAPPQEFWCQKPACFSHYSDERWRLISTPMIEEHPCLIFDPDILAMAPDMDKGMIPLVACKEFEFDCREFKRTMTSEWTLVCGEHWKVHITQCIMMFGVLLGGIVFGVWADKYGRKTPLMVGIIMQSAFSFLCTFLPTYNTFIASWFLLALASGGITIVSFVICMEAVSGKWRMIVPILYQVPFGIGSAILALLAYWYRDWRRIELGLAILSSLHILYWFFIPESPRWLIANRQYDKAAVVLQAAAAQNKKPIDMKDIMRMFPKEVRVPTPPGFAAFLKSKNMRWKTVLLSINWFCTGMSFYTFSQYLGGLGGNIFLTVAATGIISVPGPLVCVMVAMRFGRKTTIWIFQILTSCCFVAILYMRRERVCHEWVQLSFAGIGFAGLAASVPTLYLYSGEIYPTLGRNIGVGGVTTFARIGAMIAPLIVALDSFAQDLSLKLLTVTSIAQLTLLLPMPETRGTTLPETIEEAEQINK